MNARIRRPLPLVALALALGAAACGQGDGGFRDTGAARDASTQDALAALDVRAPTDTGRPDVVRPPADADAPDAAGDAAPMCGGADTDPYPMFTSPGDYTDPPGCGPPACPHPYDSFTATPNATHSVVDVSGHIAGAGACRFVVVNSACGVEQGTLGLEPDSGNFSGPIPLFCGNNVVKVICSAGTNSQIRVLDVPGRMCDGDDLRLTLTWDGSVVDGELHLVRAASHLNDATDDCTWTTCIPPRVLDWGIAGDATDDPTKDVDNVSTNGTEHITLTRAPAGLYYVLAEHWNPGGTPGAMSVQLNLQGRAPIVRTVASIAAHWVWYVGTVEFPGGAFVPSDAMSPPHTPVQTDCTGTWTFPGCGLPLPQ